MPSNYNLPTELTDAIISFLHANTYALPACACVHSSWTSSARMHLYRDIYLWGLSTWIRLGMALQHTPELVPLIKHITIDGGGRIPRNLTLDEWQKWIFPLSGLLDHLESLTVRTLELHASPDPVTDFLHTHFPRVKRLRIDSVVTPDRATLQRVLLSPRAALKSVALSRISLAKQDESSLGLISYSEVELDGSAWPAVESLLSEAAASKPVTTPQSHIRALKLNGLQLKHFPSMAAALRALGSTLESLEVRVRNTVHRRYPEAAQHMLENSTQLRSLTWLDAGSNFVHLPQDLAKILESADSSQLQNLALLMDPEGSDALLNDASCAQGWAPLARVMCESDFPSLQSLSVHWILRGRRDFSNRLQGLFRSDVRVHVTATDMSGPY